MHPLHPKDSSLGLKPVMQGRNLLIEQDDAKDLSEGQKVTLMKWGNCTITRKVQNGNDPKDIELFATYDPDD